MIAVTSRTPLARMPAAHARPRTARRFSRRSSAVLLLAASLAAGVCGAQVEREDTPRSANETPAPATDQNARQSDREARQQRREQERQAAEARREEKEKQRQESETERRELNARLEEARKRLEAAASEVAALSAEAASQAMRGFGSAFRFGPRRTVIGVQLEPAGNEAGARVQDVSPGGPAEQAGIRPGDVIVAVNGKSVKGDPEEVVKLLRDVPPESKVRVRVLREGKTQELEVLARPFDARTFVYRTDPRHDFNFDFDFDFEPGQFNPFHSQAWLRNDLEGMELTSLTPQLGRYFGTDKGLLVVRAPKESRYGLQDGDVILSVDGRVPTSASHLTRILRSYQPGETLKLRVMRDRKPLDLEITLPQNGRVRATRAANVWVESL